MRQHKSCGVVPYRNVEFLLVLHRKGHWDFPKGYMEDGESEQETAIRETKEETGLDVELVPGFREEIHYNPSEDVSKTVVFFLGNSVGEVVMDDPDGDIIDYQWLNHTDALEKLTFGTAKDVLKKANLFLTKN